MARDWGVPVWVVKLDIRKAFDLKKSGKATAKWGDSFRGAALGSKSLVGAARGTRAPRIHGGHPHQYPAEQWRQTRIS